MGRGTDLIPPSLGGTSLLVVLLAELRQGDSLLLQLALQLQDRHLSLHLHPLGLRQAQLGEVWRFWEGDVQFRIQISDSNYSGTSFQDSRFKIQIY